MDSAHIRLKFVHYLAIKKMTHALEEPVEICFTLEVSLHELVEFHQQRWELLSKVVEQPFLIFSKKSLIPQI